MVPHFHNFIGKEQPFHNNYTWGWCAWNYFSLCNVCLPSVDTMKLLVSFTPTIVVNKVTLATELQLTALSPNGIMFMTSKELDVAETSILH